jgi:hypothetical protein
MLTGAALLAMRKLPFLVVLVTAVASAQSGQVSFLAKQLATAKDPRTRTTAALALGSTKDASAVTPLCSALKDAEAVVRGAAAKALGDLQQPSAIACLKSRLGDPNPQVAQAVAKAVAMLESSGPAPSGGTGTLYVALELADRTEGGLGPADLKLAEDLLKAQLSKMGATFAPTGEAKAAATAHIKSKRMQGWMLKVEVHPHPNGLKLKMLAMTYPDKSLKGDYLVKGAAAGAKPPLLLRSMVPKLVEDAAYDLEWPTP